MLILTDENFEKEIKKADKPVLVDFWSTWCEPCAILSPILEKLAEEYQDKITFAKVDLDMASITAQKFGINRIPTVVLFKDGKPVKGFIGVRPEPVIREWLRKMLGEGERGGGKEEIKEIIKEYEKHARKNKWRLNPNKEVVERLIRGMLEREKRFGKRYCVCRRVIGNPEEDEKIVCPCVYARKEIQEQGRCFCGLFLEK